MLLPCSNDTPPPFAAFRDDSHIIDGGGHRKEKINIIMTSITVGGWVLLSKRMTQKVCFLDQLINKDRREWVDTLQHFLGVLHFLSGLKTMVVVESRPPKSVFCLRNTSHSVDVSFFPGA